MKKKLWFSLLVLLLLGATAVTGSAAGLLSDALVVLAEGSDMIKGAVAGDTVRFSAADFKQAMGIRRFDGITLTSLPDAEDGTLYFGKQAVAVGATVPRDSLNSLTFVPTDSKVTEASFSFTCDSYAGGAEIACIIRFADRLNKAPTVSSVTASQSVSTYSDHAVEGTLCATDPEGDALEFIVIGYPKNGTLTVLSSALGDFRYTPVSGFSGKDEFTFVVRDVYGNYTAPSTVSISVKKNESGLTYADMHGVAAALPALVLANENIMLGSLQGDGMYFRPDEEISRQDFLVMAMKAAGITPRDGLVNTVFDDNGAIPVGLRPYVATAQERGYVIGRFGEEGLLFSGSETLTRAEAAVILSRILEADVPVSVPLSPDAEAVPAYAKDSIDALCAMGIYPRAEEGALAANEPLDRAAAAEMLYATLLSQG